MAIIKNRKDTLLDHKKLSLTLYFGVFATILVGLVWFRFIWLPKYSVKAYTSTVASFQASELAHKLVLDNPPKYPLVVHFIDLDCPCTRYSLPYIAKLRKEFVMTTTQVDVHRGETDTSLPIPITLLSEIVPATPAVAIWNRAGELTYFGPYSSGAYCGDGEEMVRYILQSLSKGEAPSWINQEAQGCMCQWQTAEDRAFNESN